MARLNIVDPSTATGKAKEIFNGPIKGKHLNIFKGIANNPAVLGAFLGFMGGIKGGALTPAEHEQIALAVGGRNGCDYCLAAHSMMAAGTGLSTEDIESAKKGESSDAKTTALLKFTNAVIDKNGNVSDEELNAFKAAGYDDAAVVEVIGGIAVNTFTNLFNHVNNTEIDAMFQTAGATA